MKLHLQMPSGKWRTLLPEGDELTDVQMRIVPGTFRATKIQLRSSVEPLRLFQIHRSSHMIAPGCIFTLVHVCVTRNHKELIYINTTKLKCNNAVRYIMRNGMYSNTKCITYDLDWGTIVTYHDVEITTLYSAMNSPLSVTTIHDLQYSSIISPSEGLLARHWNHVTGNNRNVWKDYSR